MNRIFLTFLTLSILFRLNSQEIKKRCGIDYPRSICVSEEINDEISLNWSTPKDSLGVFLKYEIFSLESPYIAINTINNIENSSIKIPRQFTTNNFFLITTILCNGIENKYYSDTSQLINISGVKFDDGIEQINWIDEIHLNQKTAYIERSTFPFTWKTIDSLPYKKKEYFDTVNICNKNLLYYRIGIKKNGCINYSNLISDTLQDKYQPSIPTIVALGFDTINQNLILSWKKPRETDIQGIIIYQEINGLNSTLDTIIKTINPLDTFYTILKPNTTSISSYRIAAYDYCFSTPPKFQTSAQSKNYLTTLINYDYDICSKETKLTWNEAIPNDEIKYYKIHLKKNGKWKIIDSTVNSYFTLSLEKFSINNIAVEAITKAGFKYFSNSCLIYSISPSEPKISYTNYASVNGDNIEIKHTITPTTGLKDLALLKLNNQNQFIEIQKIEAKKNEIVFKDYDVIPTKYSYQYYIQEIDSCNNYTKKHKIQNTILLKENYKNEDSLSISILFNNYDGFTGGLNKYNIYKSIDNSEYGNVTEFFSDSFSVYNYKIENKDIFEGKICFKVLATENRNIYNSQSNSYSNEVCFYFDPKIFIPNSFTPNGFNPLFKPIFNVVNIETYEINIFNRWGQPVFHTTDLNEGWNGQYGNENCPNGLYIYQFKINQGSNKEIVKRGLINLIR